jgi:hypothetical protein
MSTPSPAAPAHRAHAALLDALARVAAFQRERESNPILAGAMERLARWQAGRLRQTYADLASSPRYVTAVQFFEQDLYGQGDFTKRDTDLARVTPMMVRMLPERVIGTVADAVGLHALSQELDRALLSRLRRADAIFGVTDYCRAYRHLPERTKREQQIVLIGRIGSALDAYVRKPLLATALGMMHRPAHVAGFGALHDFLERGFRAFRSMNGATEFLATVTARETALMNAIFDGDNAPFADPMGPSVRAAE